MSLSVKMAIDLISEKKGDISLDDLGFILTVLRDNSTDENVTALINLILIKL